jgi:hypothetical protein
LPHAKRTRFPNRRTKSLRTWLVSFNLGLAETSIQACPWVTRPRSPSARIQAAASKMSRSHCANTLTRDES